MKKLIIILFATLLSSISAFSQISFNAVGTKNTIPKYVGATKIGNSVMSENESGHIVVPYLAVNRTAVVGTSVATIKGETLLRAATTATNSYVLRCQDSTGTDKFYITPNGSIYTKGNATVTDTFHIGGRIFTFTNGLITSVE